MFAIPDPIKTLLTESDNPGIKIPPSIKHELKIIVKLFEKCFTLKRQENLQL